MRPEDLALQNYLGGWTQLRAAESCGWSRTKFKRFIISLKVKPRLRSRAKLTPPQLADIISAYQGGVPVEEITTRFAVDSAAVYYHLRKQGIPLRGRLGAQGELSPVDAAVAYQAGTGLLVAAKACGMGSRAFRAYLVRAGIQLHPSGKLVPYLKEIQAAYANKEPILRIAKRFGVHEGAITRWLRILGVKTQGHTGRLPKFSGAETHLYCSRCNRTLEISQFNKQCNSRTKRPGASVCKRCCCERRACKIYNITPSQYRELQSRPNCQICGVPFTATKRFIDHDHISGQVRGTLCESCNSGLGSALESPERLELLRAYLLNPVEIPAATCSGPVGDALKQRRLRVYGIRPSQYAWLLALRHGRCHCCGGPFDARGRPHPNVDHHHGTGQVRGLLCFSCNIAVGKFKDSADLISAAITYLKGTP
jgi:hypothetical protein